MTTTNYSVQLSGLNLPAGSTEKIEAELQKTVMRELASLDLGSSMEIQDMNTDRFKMPGGLAGFVVRSVIKPGQPFVSGERSVLPTGNTSTAITGLFGGELPYPLTDMSALEALSRRPDVRAAIVANSQAMMALLQADEVAYKNFNDLMTRLSQGQGQTTGERFAPLVIIAVCVGSALLGGGVGYWSRK